MYYLLSEEMYHSQFHMISPFVTFHRFFPLHLFQVDGNDNPAWSFLDYATNVTTCKFFVLLQPMNVSREIYLNPVSDQ